MKNMYIIAGCNGAGKTTAAFHLLPDTLNCREFVNADEIAKGISPFQPEMATHEAGKIMLTRIGSLIERGVDFAVETTLSALIYQEIIENAKQHDYRVSLLFLWLNSIDLAKERVRLRTLEGGHSVDDAVIERRYLRGLQNLSSVYIPLCDHVMIFDNSELKHQLIMAKIKGEAEEIYDLTTYKQIFQDHVRG